MNLILEFDDLHPHTDVDCLSVIDKLVKKIPTVHLNFFVPILYKGFPARKNEEWCTRIREHITNGNITLAPHGLSHTTEEFKRMTYPQAIQALADIAGEFECADLPFVKAFRGPHWGICEETIDALIGLGYTHLYSHKSYQALNDSFKDDIKIVYYNWNLKDPYGSFENPPESETIVAHGHTSPHAHLSCGNSIYTVYKSIVDIAESTQYKFLKVTDI